MSVPETRVREANDAPVRPDRELVVYWMTAFRRATHNFALDRAVEWAEQLDKPLVILEALRCDYPWASDRFHAFALQGMADNARYFARRPALYYPYVEPRPRAGTGLLAALGRRAAVVVGDDYPAFFHPRMARAAAAQLDARLELVDANGLLPIRTADRGFARAHHFRRFLQRSLREHLAMPQSAPLRGRPLRRLAGLGEAVESRWPRATARLLAAPPSALASLPIDHDVPVVDRPGGRAAGERALQRFVGNRLASYGTEKNHPDREISSALSPYLHFGHLAAHQVFAAVADAEGWSPDRVAPPDDGRRAGWWGMSAGAEAYLDQLVTWRELAFNACVCGGDTYDRFDTLPAWARATLEDHAGDPRPHLYSVAKLERARTHDRLWNAAQRELVVEGRMHNYLRMLWGKKILEWSPTPRAAFEAMVELNNKYALDGRDPNSYAGIFWVLGRFDRPWGPERPVFGKVRPMTSANAVRKLRVDGYLRRYGGPLLDR